jgi:radical SAM enzyme (TIGR01210 family)
LYPASLTERDRFILDRRRPRPRHDPWRYQGLLVEDERTAEGRIARSATVFLTGRECPWRCVMCDLWQYTIEEDTPRRAIPTQIAAALTDLRARSETVTQLKLYNAGSFFDTRAVPEDDYDDVAAQLRGLRCVVAESHPALVGSRVDRFLDALNRQRSTTQLEVAMGLETAHPGALERLNKRMTVDDFAVAAEELRKRGASLRTFLLISPPFVPTGEQDDWLLRSIRLAFSCGASAVSLIPLRVGNGAMDELARQSDRSATPPRLQDIERSMELAIAARPDGGRILVDLWDLDRFSDCSACFENRRGRLHAINLEQRTLPRTSCAACGAGVRP